MRIHKRYLQEAVESNANDLKNRTNIAICDRMSIFRPSYASIDWMNSIGLRWDGMGRDWYREYEELYAP